MNSNNNEDMTPNVLFALSVVLLVGTLVYLILVPKPAPGSATRGQAVQRQRLFNETADMNTRKSQAEQEIAPRLWTGDADGVTAAVLAKLSTETVARGLKLTTFRPDRSQLLGQVTELKYEAQISGPYPRVRAVLASLDTPHSKVALRSVTIGASSEGNTGASIIGDGSPPTNLVTATVGMSAYLGSLPETPSPAKPSARLRKLSSRDTALTPSGKEAQHG